MYKSLEDLFSEYMNFNLRNDKKKIDTDLLDYICISESAEPGGQIAPLLDFDKFRSKT